MFGFEIEILKFFESIRNGFLNAFFEVITMLGEEALMIVLISFLWFAIDKKIAHRMFFITVCSLGVNGVIKNLVQLPRPWTTGEVTCLKPETATGFSFPSGHTQTFATWSSVVAMQMKKWWVTLTVSVLILLVGISRMYLGAHYPSDVVVAIILAIVFAFIGNYLFDKVENKKILYLGITALLAPFAVGFLFRADAEFADFYKVYGMISSFGLAIAFEERFAPLTYDVVWWKKLLRVVIGVGIALVVKESLKMIFVSDLLQISLLLDFLRYFILVFFVGGICPWFFKKCKL